MEYLKLFETNEQYEEYLGGGDNVPKPNISLISNDKKLMWRKKISRRAYFNITDNVSKILLNDLTTIKSLKVSKDGGPMEKITLEPAWIEEKEFTTPHIFENMQCDGDLFYQYLDNGNPIIHDITGEPVYMMRTPTAITNYNDFRIKGDLTLVFNEEVTDDTLLKCGLKLLLYMPSEGLIDDSGIDAPITFGNISIPGMTPRGNELIIPIPTSVLAQYEAMGAALYYIPYHISNPYDESFVKVKTTIEHGHMRYAVTENGTYETEIEFTSNKIPYDLFSQNYKYAYHGFMGVNEDFYADMKDLPSYYHCSNMKELILPNTFKGSLVANQFEDCNSLEIVILGDGVDRICAGAFNGCKNIKVIESSNKDIIIESGALNATQLSSGTTEYAIGGTLMAYHGNEEHCVIDGSKYTYIYDDCFKNKPYKSLTITDGPIELMAYACSGCTSLTSVTFPSTLKRIGRSAFYNCDALSSITLPYGLETVGQNSFSYCDALSSLTLPESLIEVGHGAFEECNKLTEVVIPNSVKTIRSEAFWHCDNLKTVTIGKNVETVGEHAFTWCKSLRTIISHAFNAPELTDEVVSANGWFDETPNYGDLYAPYGSDYSTWLSQLGKNWVQHDICTPSNFYDLTITADDVDGDATSTTIYWSCKYDGLNNLSNEQEYGHTVSGTCQSDTFDANMSDSNIERVITFEYEGLTATTTIIQKPYTEVNE